MTNLDNPNLLDDELSVTTHGEVTEDEVLYARDRIAHLRKRLPGAKTPVLSCEVVLTRAADPARQRPALAEAVFNVDGQVVRAHVAADQMTEAIDLLDDRLRRRLERHAHARDDRRSRVQARGERDEHEWHHGDLPAQRPEYFDRPADDRQLVRRKSFAPASMTPDEAADDLDLLGHDFFLFTNLVTGSDAVLSFADGQGLELVDASGRPDALGDDTVAPIQLGRRDPPRCNVAEAIEQLGVDVAPFVFFVDADSGRGNVVYHRYDGHYGLITLE